MTKIKEENPKIDSSVTQEKPKRKKRKKKYLNNADLLAQVIKSKEQGKMTDELAKMLSLLAHNYSKQAKFSNYTYNDDMQAYAMMMVVRTWHKFNEEKSNNPFAFYTQCIKHSFIQYLNQEKRQRLIRDEILVKKGLTPSFNYQLEYEASRHVEDEEDHHQHVQTAQNIKFEGEDDDFVSY